jgi:hypothetical protein
MRVQVFCEHELLVLGSTRPTLLRKAENGWLDASIVLTFSRLSRDGEFFPVSKHEVKT